MVKFEHDEKMYPPKVTIAARDQDSAQSIAVTFSGVEQGDDLDMDITLCPAGM